MKQLKKQQGKDKKLQRILEHNISDPSNKWQPNDHSAKFMLGLRKYNLAVGLQPPDLTSKAGQQIVKGKLVENVPAKAQKKEKKSA